MINPIKSIDQKIFNERETIRLNQFEKQSIQDNGVDSDAAPASYVEKKDKVELNADVDRYVMILKNLVIPPEDRLDTSILLELELNRKVTAQEVREMIAQVEREEMSEKDSTKVDPGTADTDIRGKEA